MLVHLLNVCVLTLLRTRPLKPYLCRRVLVKIYISLFFYLFRLLNVLSRSTAQMEEILSSPKVSEVTYGEEGGEKKGFRYEWINSLILGPETVVGGQ